MTDRKMRRRLDNPDTYSADTSRKGKVILWHTLTRGEYLRLMSRNPRSEDRP